MHTHEYTEWERNFTSLFKSIFLHAYHHINLLLCPRVEHCENPWRVGFSYALEKHFMYMYMSRHFRSNLGYIYMGRLPCLCSMLARHMPAPSQLHLESWRAVLAWLCAQVNISCLSGGLISSSKVPGGELQAKWMTSSSSPYPAPSGAQAHAYHMVKIPVGQVCVREGAVVPLRQHWRLPTVWPSGYAVLTFGGKKMVGLRLRAKHCPAGLSTVSRL